MTSTIVAYVATCPRHRIVARIDIAEFNSGMSNHYCLCHRLVNWTAIEGKVSTGRCDARCWDSIRGACKCSCGGAQHATTFGVFESGR